MKLVLSTRPYKITQISYTTPPMPDPPLAETPPTCEDQF